MKAREIENKVSDITNLAIKVFLNTKVAGAKNKTTDIATLATKLL